MRINNDFNQKEREKTYFIYYKKRYCNKTCCTKFMICQTVSKTILIEKEKNNIYYLLNRIDLTVQ